MTMHYQFEWKKVWAEEEPRALLHVQAPHAMLADLAHSLPDVAAAQRALRLIAQVQSGKVRKCHLGSDAVLLEVFARKTNILYSFGEKKSTVATADLIALLRDWRKFLQTR
ncbi:MAG: hypothetical protein MUC38_09935 [Cyclobacteriaceae bacterium]|jgi:hypothetical protein|nr:hypothetical protein [Cyclobacteriaceae bacterium]